MPDTDWRIRVYYYDAGGTMLAQDISNAAFTVTIPTSTDWRIRVYYYDAGGTLLGEDISNAAFTVQL